MVSSCLICLHINDILRWTIDARVLEIVEDAEFEETCNGLKVRKKLLKSTILTKIFKTKLL